MERVYEGWVEELFRKGDANQVQEQDGGDQGAYGAIDSRELLLLVVGERDRIGIKIELLDATLGPLAVPVLFVGHLLLL